MQGKKVFQDELFATVTLEKLIPKNHLLRKLDKILDLRFVREMTKDLYSNKFGRPSIDPEVFIRMMLVAHFYGIDSDRQLCEELQFNLAYRWYCKFTLNDETPNHSSMTKIRDRFGEGVFKKIFLKVLDLCREKGLLDGGEAMIDASFVKANAALSSLVENDASEKDIKKKSKHILGKKFKNQTHKSYTDPDASLAGHTGALKGMYYKAHNTIASKNRIILDTHISTGSVNDGTLLQDRFKAVEKETRFKIKEMIADRSYGTGENLEFLEKKKVKHNIPLFTKRVGIHLNDFEFDKENNRFKCKNGKYLLPLETKSKIIMKYRTRKKDCIDCPIKNKCKAKTLKTLPQRWINVSIHHEIHAKVKELEETKLFKEKLWERMWKIEGLFAEGKNNHLLGKAKYRGRSKMQIQAYLIAIVQNMKRVIAVSFDPIASELIIFVFKIKSYLLNIFKQKLIFQI